MRMIELFGNWGRKASPKSDWPFASSMFQHPREANPICDEARNALARER
jgi:hypothetical protein